MAFGKKRGGGRRRKGGDGWEGIGKAVGWGGWIGSWRAAYNSQWFLAVITGDLVYLDRAQVNTYGGLMIEDGAAAHDSPHIRAKAATLSSLVDIYHHALRMLYRNETCPART